MDAGFRIISKDEFFKRVGPLNVMPSIVTDKWPYTSDWKHQSNGAVLGRSIGQADGTNVYYLAVSAVA